MPDDRQQKIFTKNLNRYINMTEKNQREIAADIGVSPQTFNTWCQGKALPRMGKIQALADYFKINKSDLIEEHTEEEKPNNGYYLDPGAAELAQELYERPEMRVLFDASRKATKEDIEQVADILKKLSGK